MKDREIKVLSTDYSDYGGTVVRWQRDDLAYPDCSSGCFWYESVDNDCGYCRNPDSPRFNLLTQEHQAGFLCFESQDVYTTAQPDAARLVSLKYIFSALHNAYHKLVYMMSKKQ